MATSRRLIKRDDSAASSAGALEQRISVAHVEYLSQRGLDSRQVFVEQIMRQNREMKAKLAEVLENQEQLRAQHEALTAPCELPGRDHRRVSERKALG